ncbi:uncharacterized protein LOC121745777 [Salvia splendens]|uniref:uncharacterized protein LOC121745777 n=1 Tax=Salvia splendens TaxID=180675 RepID=UPI001C26C965|nr:uncharacterized protein LOC121745777 [Salvia splendens]
MGECMVREVVEWIYQVNTGRDEQFSVNLREQTCSCRRWMLARLSCPQAIAAIETISENVDSFVSNIYSKATFQQIYAPIIYPVLGPQLWKRTKYPDIVLPEITKLPGHPKGARQKTVEEARQMTRAKARAARIVKLSKSDIEKIMEKFRKPGDDDV